MKNYYEGYWEYREKIDHLYKDSIPKRLNLVNSFIKLDGDVKILDVGCGEGSLGKLLKQNYGNHIHITGIDISEKALEMASNYYDETHRIDLENDDISENFNQTNFDYIVCVEVIEHLFYPDKLLIKFKDMIKGTGYLITSFPNFAFYKYRVECLKGIFPEEQHLYNDLEHFHYFTMPSFNTLLNNSGWEIYEYDGDYNFPLPIKYFPRTFKRRLSQKYPNFFGNQIVVKARSV